MTTIKTFGVFFGRRTKCLGLTPQVIITDDDLKFDPTPNDMWRCWIPKVKPNK